MTLGKYPNLSLANAREVAAKKRKLLTQGIDPLLEHQQRISKQKAERERLQNEAQQKAATPTVNEVLDNYLSNLSANTARDARNLFENRYCHLRKAIGKLKISDVTTDQIDDILDCHIERGRNRVAGKLYAYSRSAFEKAKKTRSYKLREWVNPFHSVYKPENSDAKPRDRTLSESEILTLWPLLDQIHPSAGGVLKIALLTGQRIEQICKMRRQDLDLDSALWDVPSFLTKTGKRSGVGHVIPLTHMALEVIRAQPVVRSGWVFEGAHHDKAVTTSGVAGALRKLLAEKQAIPAFQPRDLRRTCTTHWSRLSISAEIRNRIQDHKIAGDVEGQHYNRFDYLEPKRNALERWQQELKRVLGTNEGNVIALRDM